MVKFFFRSFIMEAQTKPVEKQQPTLAQKALAYMKA